MLLRNKRKKSHNHCQSDQKEKVLAYPNSDHQFDPEYLSQTSKLGPREISKY